MHFFTDRPSHQTICTVMLTTMTSLFNKCDEQAITWIRVQFAWQLRLLITITIARVINSLNYLFPNCTLIHVITYTNRYVDVHSYLPQFKLSFCNLVVCDPPCQNDAPCVANDTCNCNTGFTGPKCAG